MLIDLRGFHENHYLKVFEHALHQQSSELSPITHVDCLKDVSAYSFHKSVDRTPSLEHTQTLNFQIVV